MENLSTNSNTNTNPDSYYNNTNTNNNYNNNMNISSESFIRNSSAGIKFLLNIRNFKAEELENDEFVKENKKILTEENFRSNYENMDETYYNKHLNEMDDMIKDIKNTKAYIKMAKMKETIKTREDIMNFYQIKDHNQFSYAPEPIIRDATYLKNLNLNNSESHQKNKEFKEIQNIIDNQNNNMKDIIFMNSGNNNTYNNNDIDIDNNINIKGSMFPTSIKFKNELNSKYNIDNGIVNGNFYNKENKKYSKGFEFGNPIMNRNSYDLTEEERNFMNKYVYNTNDSDDLMDELDECIKLGEEIDDYIK
jgi:hypothetical protein